MPTQAGEETAHKDFSTSLEMTEKPRQADGDASSSRHKIFHDGGDAARRTACTTRHKPSEMSKKVAQADLEAS